MEWGGNGEGMEMGRSVYEQPGTKVGGTYHAKEGFQVSKGKWKRSKRESEREAKARELRHKCVSLYTCTY